MLENNYKEFLKRKNNEKKIKKETEQKYVEKIKEELKKTKFI